MGGDDVYLTHVLGPGVEVTLNCCAVMGGNDIFVPAGVRVIDRSVNILAGSDIDSAAQGDGSNGTLILTGFSVMGGHDIKIDPASLQPRD